MAVNVPIDIWRCGLNVKKYLDNAKPGLLSKSGLLQTKR